MEKCYKPIIVMTLGVLAVCVSVFGSDGQTLPSPHYLEDDVQYFPPGPEIKLEAASKEHSSVLGDLLFTDVVSVHFIGPGHPANPDGSFGGLAAGDDGTQMRIYQRYIVLDATDADGTTFRTLHAYDQIGNIDQRLPKHDTMAN
ncbi:hypothetical protein KOR42_10560 [Thalassoglobus neptunius]|uniref:Uncharacterized protein n=1 Tax=Thalassoglobus neptunius TaxID=1938619 RepID=A0A5C5X6Q2_9PLAN|nr:hypothetical protein [Thalassoglobus neptunius]TWT57692.1 hypothetical protein KOR42_10560 [Thalassoglobus neptunius]